MSWSISLKGPAHEVSGQAGAELAKITRLPEPEASLKSEVGQLIALALGNAPKTAMVTVTASGSQSLLNPDRPADGARTIINLNIRTE